jgi:hypothetical protein
MLVSITSLETLSRFVLQKNWYRSSDNTVRHAAFMPNPNNGKTSVFRIYDLFEKEVWEIGDREVASKLGKPVLGRADIGASNVMAKGLMVLPSEPPERHANIVGWPEEKSGQKLIALELATEAHFHKR